MGSDVNKAISPGPRPRPWLSRPGPRPQPSKPRPKPRKSENATSVIWWKRGTVYLAKRLEITSNSRLIFNASRICKCFFHAVTHYYCTSNARISPATGLTCVCPMWTHGKAARIEKMRWTGAEVVGGHNVVTQPTQGACILVSASPSLPSERSFSSFHCWWVLYEAKTTNQDQDVSYIPTTKWYIIFRSAIRHHDALLNTPTKWRHLSSEIGILLIKI